MIRKSNIQPLQKYQSTLETTDIPYGFVRDGKIFKSSWGEFPEREIGEVRDDDVKKSSQFFNDRFADLAAKIKEVTEKIDETENKGSFLMKLVHLKEQLPVHDGLGDYESLLQTIAKYESLVRDIIQKNRQRNSEIKKALIEETSEIEKIINWKEATEKVNDLKARWIKTGSAEEEINQDLEDQFWKVITAFFDRKKQFFEDKQRLIEHRNKQYETLVAESATLSEMHGKARFDKVKKLKEEWKEIGGIPAELYKPLFDQFNVNMKGKKYSQPSADYSAVLQALYDIKDGKADFDRQKLEQLKKNLFKDKRRSPDKKKAVELIQLLNERDFIAKLVHKRFPDYAKLDPEKKKSVKVGIVKDLISRDTDDLKTYEENSANFSSSNGKMNKLVEGKINGQKRKIDVKNKLLGWIEDGTF